MRRQPRLTDGDGRGPEGAPVEVAVAQHAAAGALEHQVVGALPGRGRGDLLGQEPGGGTCFYPESGWLSSPAWLRSMWCFRGAMAVIGWTFEYLRGEHAV